MFGAAVSFRLPGKDTNSKKTMAHVFSLSKEHDSRNSRKLTLKPTERLYQHRLGQSVP